MQLFMPSKVKTTIIKRLITMKEMIFTPPSLNIHGLFRLPFQIRSNSYRYGEHEKVKNIFERKFFWDMSFGNRKFDEVKKALSAQCVEPVEASCEKFYCKVACERKISCGVIPHHFSITQVANSYAKLHKTE